MKRQNVYLIPGTMCNEQLWVLFLPLLEDLKELYEFVYVKIPRDKCFSQISTYLNDYFKERQVNIIGFSLGGYIATHFATTFPHRVDKVFVIANSPCTLPLAEEKQRQEIVGFVNNYGYKGMSKARATQLFDTSSMTQHQLDHLISIMINMDAELGEAEFKSQMHCTSKREDLFAQLACTQVQLAFYYSVHDSLVNSTWLQHLQQVNANCVMICISGESHMLPLEKPKELADHIHTWLSSS